MSWNSFWESKWSDSALFGLGILILIFVLLGITNECVVIECPVCEPIINTTTTTFWINATNSTTVHVYNNCTGDDMSVDKMRKISAYSCYGDWCDKGSWWENTTNKWEQE